jgi:phospholipid-binding lipoprotein MlaA
MTSLDRRIASGIAPAFVLVVALLSGCATTQSRVDPLEPWNRAMYKVHTTLDDAIVKPVAQGYVKVTPPPVRTGVSNFFGNIDDLFSGINDVLQGNGNRAGDAFGRVLLNSTFGIAGIFDLASMMGINKDPNDFGLTFGKWGAPQGPYLFVPLFGPTTVRDGSGWLVRIYSDPIGFINEPSVSYSLFGLDYLNRRAQLLDAEGVLDAAALDRYLYLRNAYLRARRYQLYEGKPPPDEDDQ